MLLEARQGDLPVTPITLGGWESAHATLPHFGLGGPAKASQAPLSGRAGTFLLGEFIAVRRHNLGKAQKTRERIGSREFADFCSMPMRGAITPIEVSAKAMMIPAVRGSPAPRLANWNGR